MSSWWYPSYKSPFYKWDRDVSLNWQKPAERLFHSPLHPDREGWQYSPVLSWWHIGLWRKPAVSRPHRCWHTLTWQQRTLTVSLLLLICPIEDAEAFSPWSLDFDEDLLRVDLTHADTHSHGDKECWQLPNGTQGDELTWRNSEEGHHFSAL